MRTKLKQILCDTIKNIRPYTPLRLQIFARHKLVNSLHVIPRLGFTVLWVGVSRVFRFGSGFANVFCSNMILVVGVLGIYAQLFYPSALRLFDVLLKIPWLEHGLFDTKRHIDTIQRNFIRSKYHP
jgi:hypothetical protein